MPVVTDAASVVEQPRLREIAAAADPAQLRAAVEALVSFGTRHTLSDTAAPTRGIGAARRWARTLGKFSAVLLAYLACAAATVFLTGLYSAETL